MKKLLVAVFTMRGFQTKSKLENYTKQLLENLIRLDNIWGADVADMKERNLFFVMCN